MYMRYNSHASVYSTQSTSDAIGGYICLSGKEYECIRLAFSYFYPISLYTGN